MVQKQSQETPFLFSLQEEGRGQHRDMGICKDSLLHLHRIKKTFTSVGSGSGALATASSGTLAAPSLFSLGLSLDVRRIEGSWDFAPPRRARRGGGRLRVCVFGKAFRLIVYSVSIAGPQAATPALQMLPAGVP